MNQRQIIVVALTTAVSLVYTAWADDGNDTHGTKTPPDTPKGWIALKEDFWLPLAHEPGSYFHQAHEEYLMKEYDLAAIDIRQAAAFLKLQARRSTDTEHATALYAAANRLSNLATQVERKEVKSAAELNREFARAHYALAEHDYVMAQESWNKQHRYTTGYNLDAAVFNVESGYSWANAEMGKPGFNAVADANTLANELIAGKSKRYEVTATFDAVHDAIYALSTQINKLPKDPGLAMDEPVITAAPAIEPGWVLVDENIWTDLPDSAGQHLQNVYEAYLERHAKKAATAIHQAVFDVQMQAGRATGDDLEALMSSIRDLKRLLDTQDPSRANIELSREHYDQAIANTCYALAQHHCEMAESDWEANLSMTAGYDLKWAANFLDRGQVWADQLKDHAIEAYLHDARQLSKALIAGHGDYERNVVGRIKSLEREVMTLRSSVVAMTR